MNQNLPFFVDVSDVLSKWRVDSFWTKEKETIAWLQFFSSDSKRKVKSLIDVGANVGLYTLYWLHLDQENTTISCEPFDKNTILLQRNLELNSFSDRVLLIESPLDSESTFGLLDISDTRPGGSGLRFSRGIKSTNPVGLETTSLTLDGILAGIDKPSILKIDVDGLDFEVLKGGRDVLSSGCIQSILIEADEETHKMIHRYLTGLGFDRDEKFNSMSDHSDARRKLLGNKERNRVYSLTHYL